ncbi:cytochrome c [Paraflavisolibacter sp. H34]|uniref:c-type cytochrome n=1 Tax=Huijunlia imazamoxiresistens TaxID=3127457 RepID=UPI003015DE14
MKTKFFALLLALCSVTALLAAPPAEEGKAIFSSRCAGCHSIHKQLTGPALAGVDKRHSIEWIINFVHSSQKVIKGGDAAAVALFNQFNKVQMPDHPDLTDDNIKSVVEYIKEESSAVAAAPAAEAPKASTSALQLFSPAENPGLFTTLLILLSMLGVSLVFLKKVKELRRKSLEEKAIEVV